MTPRMHPDQIDSDTEVVRGLLRAQFPNWAALPVTPVRSTGTDTALYRLGTSLVARLPLRPAAAGLVEKERRWLPVLAPHLPLAVPQPVARGEPSEEYPWPWSVHTWIEGEDATRADLDLVAAARDLSRFLRALQAIDAAGGPEPNVAGHGRGCPLAARDRYTRDAIAASYGLVDTRAVTVAWESALRIPPYAGPRVWLHGDVAAGNLLVLDGRIRAVIDWGALGTGDPACDLIVAWELLDAESRSVLRSELDVDGATWERGRGWALTTAIVALPYYVRTNGFMAEQARRKITAVLGR